MNRFRVIIHPRASSPAPCAAWAIPGLLSVAAISMRSGWNRAFCSVRQQWRTPSLETAPLFAQHAVIVAVFRYGGKRSSCRQVFSLAAVVATVRYLQTMFVFPCWTSWVRIPSPAPSSPSHLRELSALPGLFSRLFDRPSNREMGRKAGMSNSVGVQDRRA